MGGVILESTYGGTGSALTVTIPTGRHSPLLIAFQCVWNTDSSLSRGAISGGGGLWTTAADETVIRESSYARLYTKYSIPTETGSVSISTGSYSGLGRYTIIFVVHNALYRSIESDAYIVPSVSSVSFSQDFGSQGGMLIGCAAASADEFLGTGVLPDSRTSIDESYLANLGADYAGFYAYHRKHTGQYDKLDSAGISWGAYMRCVHSQLALDSVQCSI